MLEDLRPIVLPLLLALAKLLLEESLKKIDRKINSSSATSGG